MNISRTSAASYFCFGDGAAGTGGSPPASTPAAGASTPSAPEPGSALPLSTTTPGGGTAPGTDPEPDPFSGLGGDFDSDLDQVILPDAPATVAGAPASPAAPAAPAQVPAAQTAPAAVLPSPDPGAAPPQAPVVTSSASPREQLDVAVDGFKTNSAALADWAGKELFKLSDEDATALATNAEEVIPRLMGRVYTQCLAAAGNLIRNFTPNMIDHAIEQKHTSRTKSEEAVSEFYKTNSDLNEKDHGAWVSQWAKAFRSANPKATRAEAIDYVARAVRIQAGLPMQGAAAPAAARAAPFSPARPGGRQLAPPSEHDPYAGLGMDHEQ